MKNKGILYVVSGPSGVGKGTICKILLAKDENLSLSVSATTRVPREEDTEGVTYFFKTHDEFKKMIDEDKFLEWAVYNGNYYGTPSEPVEEGLKNGRDIILEIDVQGALNVMEKAPDSVSIFIAPPDKEALYARLRNRGSENEDEIEKRIMAAERELELKERYDYVVINDDLDDAVRKIENIMNKEKELL